MSNPSTQRSRVTKTKRINITIPERDLESIDDYAKRHKMSRSAFLLDAAKRAMT